MDESQDFRTMVFFPDDKAEAVLADIKKRYNEAEGNFDVRIVPLPEKELAEYEACRTYARQSPFATQRDGKSGGTEVERAILAQRKKDYENIRQADLMKDGLPWDDLLNSGALSAEEGEQLRAEYTNLRDAGKAFLDRATLDGAGGFRETVNKMDDVVDKIAETIERLIRNSDHGRLMGVVPRVLDQFWRVREGVKNWGVIADGAVANAEKQGA
jgi:hypothetical protein